MVVTVTCAHQTCGVDAPSASNNNVASWAETLDDLKHQPELARALPALMKLARDEVKKGLVRRVYRLEDVGKHRTWLDGRSKVLEDEIRETFALAISDFSACNLLADALPTAAAATKLTGDAAIREHLLAQLHGPLVNGRRHATMARRPRG